MQYPNFLTTPVFDLRTRRTLEWLEMSIQKGDGGSAADFHLLRGWGLPYPETTGYIIETLLDYADYYNEVKWKNLALQCADWLCDVQRADGAFPGGPGLSGAPLVFDTGQILFGLTRSFLATGEIKYQNAVYRAVEWLLKNVEPDGSWQRYVYVPGYVPAYHARVVWAVLYANTILQNKHITDLMQQALQYHISKILCNFFIENQAFGPYQMAYTHTIAYTLRGMLESAQMLQDESSRQKVLSCIDHIVWLWQQHGCLAGRYDAHWAGDYSFRCVTGDAQMSLLMGRAYHITNNQTYLDAGLQIFTQVVPCQCALPVAALRGAIPGSVPLWGPYQRLGFPNWAAKFYLDAYLLFKKCAEEWA